MTVLTGCGGSSSSPDSAASAYLSAWSKQDWAAMRQLVSNPPADFTSVNSTAFSNLAVRTAAFSAGPAQTSGGNATVPVTERLGLAELGTISLTTKLHLVSSNGTWLVNWSPATISPRLRAGDQLSLRTSWPNRAPVLGAGGVPLTTDREVVQVGLEGSRVKKPAVLTRALVAAGATAKQVRTALASARQHPTFFTSVFSVPLSRYQRIKASIYSLPGTVFNQMSARSAITPGLTSGLVGSVGPVTAEELHSLGGPYNAQSQVGQTGLEGASEKTLAGTPGAKVAIVDSRGAVVSVLATMPSRAGTPVRTTISPAVQRSAEAALSGVRKRSAALVAVNARTGAVLAADSVNSSAYDIAVLGTYPPGSTFKVITSAALIGQGLTPSSAASCPKKISVGGEVFHNAEGEGQVANLLHAFAESCNTAFISLATKHLTASGIASTAATFGLGHQVHMGLAAYNGSVPVPADSADLAATSIGQGRVLASPLNMAMVAAAADTGVVRAPRLVIGAPDDSAPSATLPSHVVSSLHQLMASVTAYGTASGQGLPAGTFGKTGTAEYGTGKHKKIDAWLIGFHGNIAFACLVTNSAADGGPTCGPIAARFLSHI